MNLLLAATTIATSLLVPFNDLGPGPYAWGYFGGLWEDGSNTIPADHLAAGLIQVHKIEPLDVNGKPSPDGKIVFMSVGGDEAHQIFGAFSAKALSNPHVRRDNLVLANAAELNYDAVRWTRDTDQNYDRVDNAVLRAAGITPKQVQVAWLDMSVDYPYSPLPISDGDAYRLKGHYANALRALKVRYPNLRAAYLSSRVFGGYSTLARNPEPYAYESVLAVRWVVVGQVLSMRIADIGPYWDTRVGDVNYARGTVPWTTWGPYLWANGTTPRLDGLFWMRDDFAADGEALSEKGASKAGDFMLRSFLREPTTAGWFTETPLPARARPAHH
jgi:hypothetical protein